MSDQSVAEAPQQSKQVAVRERKDLSHVDLTRQSLFSSSDAFELGWRMAAALCSSGTVPDAYAAHVLKKSNRGGSWVEEWIPNPAAQGNCLIAIELSNRLKVSPLAVMQNVDMIKGRPSFRGSFQIALIKSARDQDGNKRFKEVRFEQVGEPGATGSKCRMTAIDVETDEVLNGTWVTWKMVVDEKWLEKDGSKWKTMPELMFQYRSATFWGRVHAPELLLGLGDEQEAHDIQGSFTRVAQPVSDLSRRLEAAEVATEATPHGDAGTEGGESPQPGQPEKKPRVRRRSAGEKPQEGVIVGGGEPAGDAGRPDDEMPIDPIEREKPEPEHEERQEPARPTTLPSDNGVFSVE